MVRRRRPRAGAARGTDCGKAMGTQQGCAKEQGRLMGTGARNQLEHQRAKADPSQGWAKGYSNMEGTRAAAGGRPKSHGRAPADKGRGALARGCGAHGPGSTGATEQCSGFCQRLLNRHVMGAGFDERG
jgi:hypothetical protein